MLIIHLEFYSLLRNNKIMSFLKKKNYMELEMIMLNKIHQTFSDIINLLSNQGLLI